MGATPDHALLSHPLDPWKLGEPQAASPGGGQGGLPPGERACFQAGKPADEEDSL